VSRAFVAFVGLRIAADMSIFEEINLSDFIIGLFIISEEEI
jgi:hypothetical protein